MTTDHSLTEKSTVTAYGTPISSVREYRLPMVVPVVSMMLLRPACGFQGMIVGFTTGLLVQGNGCGLRQGVGVVFRV